LPRHANQTSFKPGHRRSPESIEKQRRTLKARGRPGHLGLGWTDAHRTKYQETMRRKYPRPTLVCQNCEQPFTPKKLYHGRILRFCSRRCCALSHHNEKLLPFDPAEAWRLWRTGLSALRVALALGVERGVVYRWLKAVGLYEPRPASGPRTSTWRGGVKLSDAMRQRVINLAGNRCEQCGYGGAGEHPEILQIHHRDRNNRNNVITNLILLCPNCHTWEHYRTVTGLYSGHKRKPLPD
jgi:hypothetical protein